jgi:hypothetical protein
LLRQPLSIKKELRRSGTTVVDFGKTQAWPTILEPFKYWGGGRPFNANFILKKTACLFEPEKMIYGEGWSRGLACPHSWSAQRIFVGEGGSGYITVTKQDF